MTTSLARMRFCFLILMGLVTACNGTDPGQILLSTGAVDISLGGKSFTIQNTGPVGSTLNWQLTVAQNGGNPTASDWFTLSIEQGALAAGESQAVVIVPESDLTEGTYNATVTVSASGEQEQVRVSAIRSGDITSCIAPTITARQRALTPRFPEREILVRYRDTTSTYESAAKRLSSQYKLNTVVSGEGIVPDVVVAEDGARDDLIARLSRDPDILYAVPNDVLSLQQTPTIPIRAIRPNDALYSLQWHLNDFGIPQAWALETGKGNVTVAIIDSSVDTDHEDLINALVPGCDLFDRDDDPNPGPFDPGGFNTRPTHGTHTAGMVAATGNNGIGVAGVAFSGVQILPVKVFNDAGVGAQIDDLINGIRWSVGLAVPGFNPNPHPAQILNLSLGTRGQNAAIDEAVAEAVGAGALVIAASGNQSLSSEVLTPANAEGALSVGSVDSDYLRSDFSNYNQNEPQVDLMAPGGKLVGASDDFCASGSDDNILSTFAGDNYGCLAGTSMSSPFVAGVAALIWSQNPDFTAEQVTERMLTSTFTTPGQDPFQYGAGVLCADRALGAATLCGR
ncbi:MAG: S8 family serine peptidase [Deinococcota bacterium]